MLPSRWQTVCAEAFPQFSVHPRDCAMSGHSMGIPFEFVPVRLDASLMATATGLVLLLSAWAISRRRGPVLPSVEPPVHLPVQNATGMRRRDVRGNHFVIRNLRQIGLPQ